MQIDLTLPITKAMWEEAGQNTDPALSGHLGTHFDVMDRAFPLAYTERRGIVFDVSSVCAREIGVGDIALDAVEAGMFVAFYTGYSERVSYGATGYFSAHPVLSFDLIEQLLQRGVSVIGTDCGGIRSGKEHTPCDRHCADHRVFVVENLRELPAVLACGGRFVAHTYPLALVGTSGLPCRVIAEI